jgi:WD40 repeat protein/tetratricopeptide (TPR) repeat protein
VLDIETGKEVCPPYEHDQEVVSMAWRSDGRLLAAACTDQRIYVWNHVERRLQSVLEGHAGLGIVIKFSNAGDFLISTGWDGTTRLWDPVSGRQLVQGEGHFVDLGRDDRQLALMSARRGPSGAMERPGTSGSTERESPSQTAHTYDLGMWEVAGGWECRTLHHGFVGNRTRRPDHWGPTSLDFAPDGSLLASSHLDGVRLWDLAGAVSTPEQRGAGNAVAEIGHLPMRWTAHVRFHPKGDSLFTYGLSGLHHWPLRHSNESTANRQSSILDPRSSRVLQIGLPHTFDVPGNWTHPTIDCDRLGQRLIALDHARSRALIYDLKEPGRKRILRHPGLNVCTLSLDGRWVLTSSYAENNEANVKVWDAAEGKVVWRPPGGNRIGFFTPDGRCLVTSPPRDGALRVWELGSWHPERTLPRPNAKPLTIAPTPDGMMLVSMEPGPPRFFNTATGKELATLEAPRNYGGAAGARFSPDGTWLAVATGNHTVHLWDLRAIRRGLADLDLDWELPAYPPPIGKAVPGPVRLEVSAEVADFIKVRDVFLRALGQTDVKQWQAAIESYSQAIEQDPSYYDAYIERGRAYAELRQWPQAEADFAKAIELAPDQSGAWYSRALVCLARDDDNAYRTTRTAMVKQFGETPMPDDAYWTAWTCAMRPDSETAAQQTVRMAETLLADPTPHFDDLVVLGAVLYRAGRFKEAVGRLNEAAQAHNVGQHRRQAIIYTWLYLAMAEHRLGRSEAARKWLDRAADAFAKDQGNGADDPLANDRGPWNRRLTLALLRREAEAVLKEPR